MRLHHHYVPAAGEPPIPLDDTYPLSVTFIGVPMDLEGTPTIKPIGTGFIVAVPRKAPRGRPGKPFKYLVTAKHNVEGEPETYARIRSRTDGEPPRDIPIPKWLYPCGTGVDIAVTRFSSDSDSELNYQPIGLSTFTDAEGYPHLRPLLGDRVYFIGLLSSSDSMGARNIPMVRSGSIGALYEHDIAVNERLEPFPEAHLIDCRSYYGFSGSPCFYQRDNTIAPLGRVEGDFDQRVEATLGLGLLSGHFDLAERVSAAPDKQTGGLNIWATVPSGVGVVTPAEAIKEAVMALNEEDEAGRREDGPIPRPVTLDRVKDDDLSEFDRFENLAKKLVNTPKPKPDEDES